MGERNSVKARAVMASLTVTTLIGGCGSDMLDLSSTKKQVPIAVSRDMERNADRYARDIIEWIGAPVTPQGGTTDTPPCDGSGTSEAQMIYRSYNVTLRTEDHLAAFERVRAGMTTDGYSIPEYDAGPNVGGGTGGRMRAKSPDGYGFMVSSTFPPSEITIWVFSPCFVPASASTEPAVSST